MSRIEKVLNLQHGFIKELNEIFGYKSGMTEVNWFRELSDLARLLNLRINN